MEKDYSRFLNSKLITILILSTPIWAFVLVNCINYEDSVYTVDFSNICNVNFSFVAIEKGVQLYFSILALMGIILAIIQFLKSNEQTRISNYQTRVATKQLDASLKQTNLMQNNTNSILKQTKVAFQQLEKINKLVITSNNQLNFSIQKNNKFEEDVRKSIVNGLLEEIRHNIDLVDFLEITEEKTNKLHREIAKSLQDMGTVVYPLPFDSEKWKSLLNNDFFIQQIELPPINKLSTIHNMRTIFLENAITQSLSTIRERIFLNLGHLYYSLTRYNDTVNIYNNHLFKLLDYYVVDNEESRKKMMLAIGSDWKELQIDYSQWLHLRLHFTLIDLIISYDPSDFVDREFVRNIQQQIDSNL
jgi:hypothetical protein